MVDAISFLNFFLTFINYKYFDKSTYLVIMKHSIIVLIYQIFFCGIWHCLGSYILTQIISNRPFARSSHMVRNKLCRETSYTVGLSKQMKVGQNCYAFFLFWKFICIICFSAQFIPYHVTESCKGPNTTCSHSSFKEDKFSCDLGYFRTLKKTKRNPKWLI